MAFPTFEDVERAALNDVILRHILEHYHRGACTREQALIIAVLQLSKYSRQLFDASVEQLMRRCP